MTTANPPAILPSTPPPPPPAPPQSPARTVWGLDPLQLHSRFWASRGIQVVRQGEPSEIVRHAELFLLADPRTLTIFRLITVIEQLSWLDSELMFVRINDTRDRGYREFAETHPLHRDRFVRFRREYGASDSRLTRIALTPDQEIAKLWQSAPDPLAGWRCLRRLIRRRDRWTMSVSGRVYDRQSDHEVAAFVRDLVETWSRPDSTIQNIQPVGGSVWAPEGVRLAPGSRFVGPVWVGAGRSLPGGAAAVGPAVMWDDQSARPLPEDIQWLDLEPTAPPSFARPKARTPFVRGFKRAFDIAFALAALAATVPLYPFIALAIMLEDPGPIFFTHRRETKGGRVFGCIKFRSMKKNAEQIKRDLAAQNKADGPQFYIPNDPRLTRVGAFLRKYQLDELPQFVNVLLGHMSVVGPRPSPFEENQYCPPWREARLSVRPGITGLWQIKRTRAAGSDFQEWIRYDIEYVERATFWLDLYIIWKTVMLVVRGVTRS
jgi:lipopolysaccharide/colanic/teichoic acid biosynthesis glycosyltransferase